MLTTGTFSVPGISRINDGDGRCHRCSLSNVVDAAFARRQFREFYIALIRLWSLNL